MLGPMNPETYNADALESTGSLSNVDLSSDSDPAAKGPNASDNKARGTSYDDDNDNFHGDDVNSKRRKLRHGSHEIDNIYENSKYQAPPGHHLNNSVDDAGIAGVKYSLRVRKVLPPRQQESVYETRRSRSARQLTRQESHSPPSNHRTRDRDRGFYVKLENLTGTRPETRGKQSAVSYKEIASDDDEFEEFLASNPRSRSDRRPKHGYNDYIRRRSSLSDQQPSSSYGSSRRVLRGTSLDPDYLNNDADGDGSSSRTRPLRQTNESTDRGLNDGSGAQQDTPMSYPKISLKLNSNTPHENDPNAEIDHEIFDIDGDDEDEPPIQRPKARKLILDDDDEEEDIEVESKDSGNDYQYNEHSERDSLDGDLSDEDRRAAQPINRYSSETGHKYTEKSKSLPNQDDRHSFRRRPSVGVPFNNEEKALEEQRRDQARKSRAARAAQRQRRFMGEFEDIDDILGTDGEHETDSQGIPRRRLRPRKEHIDYSRQLHPGAGWAGQPIEALLAERSMNRYRGGKNTRRDRDERQFSYKPGKFSSGGGGFDSDSDNDNAGFTGKNGGRREVGKGGFHGNDMDPINIMEILNAQEHAILKDLPEEERKKYEENARLFRPNGGKDLADTDPVSTNTVNFDSIGGLEDHIRSLKEMVVMPLLYPEIFSSFQISAPRGVLFHGPPGTGKTLMARALASSCSTSTQKVAFFMRKGADVLSKWVGESERQLRLLFEQAKTYQPSIIFFDEIDGLAPVRSSKQDQIHASIVSTLLALMDGLDSRGQVVVIGATNRIDAIDPALRRPGRFDRELYFPLPSESARKKIISITTSKWNPPIPEKLSDDLSKSTRGYCGADVRSLCTEAALNAVRRSYPEIYESSHKLAIDTNNIHVTAEDFAKSMKNIIPSTQRTSTMHSNPVPFHLKPLVQEIYKEITESLGVLCPMLQEVADAHISGFVTNSAETDNTSSLQAISSSFLSYIFSFQPRLIICGPSGMGQRVLGPAALEFLESRKVYIQALDLSTLLSDSSRSLDAAIIQLFHEMKRHRPAVLYIPEIDLWWKSLPENAQFVFSSLLDRDPMNPVMILATCEIPFEDLENDIQQLIIGRFGKVPAIEGWKRVITTFPPNQESRKAFFNDLLTSVKQPPKLSKTTKSVDRAKPLPRAPSPPPRELTESEIDALVEHDENLRRQLRMELRFIVNDIKRNKRFSEFHRPVDPDAFPDYYTTVTRPMDLETLLYNVNRDRYAVLDDFVDDFERIIDSAEEYNESGSSIVGKAYDLGDTFMTYINTLKKREPQFIWELQQSALRLRLINEQRKKNGKELVGRERYFQKLQADAEKGFDAGEGEMQGENIIQDESPIDADILEKDGNDPPQRPIVKRVRVIIDDDDDEAEVEKHAEPLNLTVAESGVISEEFNTGISTTSVNTEHPHTTTVHEVVQNYDLSENDVDDTLAKSIFDVAETVVTAEHEEVKQSPIHELIAENDPVKSVGEPEMEMELIIDLDMLNRFEIDLLDRTSDWRVSDLEGLAVALSTVVFKHSHEWDRSNMINELKRVLVEASAAL